MIKFENNAIVQPSTASAFRNDVGSYWTATVGVEPIEEMSNVNQLTRVRWAFWHNARWLRRLRRPVFSRA
jgi:hypothetical protein